MPIEIKNNFSFFKTKKWPAKYQWKQFFKVLSKKEKIFFFIFFLVFLASLIFLLYNFYRDNTEIKPAQGGTHIEGVVGQPRFINPVYANSDVDRDLVELIFSGLMKYDENMNIVPDLAESFEIEENGKIYKFYLKENILWQDKTPLTAEDVVFTVKTIQNPDYKSPLRPNWVGVEVEKIGDLGIKFTLKKPYGAFLENCAIKIIPKHVWQDIPSGNSAFDEHNLNPIGSGPYKLKEFDKEKPETAKSFTLTLNHSYFGKKPNISEIKFVFFNSEKELIEAARKNKIKGLSLTSFEPLGKKWQDFHISLPRYFAVFFNPEQSDVLSDKKVRIALNYGVDKKELVKKVLGLDENSPLLDKVIVDSPVLPEIYGFDQPLETYGFDAEKAKALLDEAGFKENQQNKREKIIDKKPSFEFKSDLKLNSKGTEVQELQRCLAKFPDVYPEGEISGYFGRKTEEAVKKFQEKYGEEILKPWGFSQGTGLVSKTTRQKLNEVCFEVPDKNLTLKFSLATVDQAQMVNAAEELKRQWEVLGAEIEIQTLPISQLEQDFIKPRNYDALLFGEVLGAVPDPFPFWHSSQKKDPGLNLAIYENSEADKILENIRQSSDPQFRAEKLASFQNILISDAPVAFLYCPDYIYLTSEEIKGIKTEKIVDPSKRFAGIENWYIKTERVFK